MNISVRSVLGTLACLLVSACGSVQEEDSKPSWWVNFDASTSIPGRYDSPGHEYLLKFSIEDFHRTTGTKVFLPVQESDINRPEKSTNPLVVGNFSTDRPDETAFGRRLRSIYNVNGDWHNSPKLQSIHSLRDHSDKGLVSDLDTCRTIQNRILGATLYAYHEFKSGRVEESHRYLGHATHIIQDSYSPLHTARSSEGIDSVCSYGKEEDGSCYHKKISLQDNIFSKDVKDCGTTSDSQKKCLVPLAAQAVEATTNYLKFAVNILNTSDFTKINQATLDFIENSSNGLGLSCNRLKNKHPSIPFTPSLDNRNCSLTHEEVNFDKKFSSCVTHSDKLLPNVMILKRTFSCGSPGATGTRNEVTHSKVTVTDFSCLFSVVDSFGVNAKEVVKEYADGSKFEGTLIDGKRSKIGDMTFADGRYYLGTWDNDVREGTGTLTYGQGKDTLSYEGGWKLDQPNGIGTYKFRNGGVYKGEVTKNRFHGKGEYKAPDGTILKGTYSEGLRHGEFLRTELNGNQFKDIFAKDVLISSTKLN